VKAVVAVVQAGSVLMDREATLDKTVGLVKEAATEGANLVVLPEVFIPGTPLGKVGGLTCWENFMHLTRFLSLLARDRCLARANACDRGQLGRDDEAHRARGPLLRGGCESLPPHRSGPLRFPGSRPPVDGRRREGRDEVRAAMSKVMSEISMSLDGFITGPNVGALEGPAEGLNRVKRWS